MRVEMNDFKTKPLFSIEFGELFIYNSELHMRTTGANAQLMKCVNLSNGKLTEIYGDTVVKYVPSDRVKVVIE